MCDVSTGCTQKTTGRTIACRAYELMNLKKKQTFIQENRLNKFACFCCRQDIFCEDNYYRE